MKRLVTATVIAASIATSAMADFIRPQARPAVEACNETTSEDQCMKCALYHEARGETFNGQLAVALVLMNRVQSPRYPNTMCEVVWQKGYVRSTGRWVGQFSFTTDGRSDDIRDMRDYRIIYDVMERAKEVHSSEVNGDWMGLNRNTLWYHATWVSPSWANGMRRNASIGVHTFYSK